MMAYTRGDIERYLARIKRMARRAFEKGDPARALALVDTAAVVASNLNRVFADPESEDLMAAISESLAGEEWGVGYPVHKERWLFYDQIAGDTVLSLQYLRALMSWGVEILYVFDSPVPPRGSVIEELRGYPRATVLVLAPRLARRVEAFVDTLRTIKRFGPSRALIHGPAEGAFGVAMLHALKDTVKYRIVPGDHHFYLGTSVTDHAIEFRPFGVTVALEKRGFRREQIIMQPYYPIVRDARFEGFGFDPAGRVLIFSGGSYYKILGGDEAFFRIVKRITDRHPEVIVQFSGYGTPQNRKMVRGLIKKHGLGERFFLDGFRGDVNEVMRRCDIYLGTYPLCGGLMSQYAAVNAKPILQYLAAGDEVNRIEDIIGLDDPSVRITFTDIDALVAEADRLIASPEARRSVGEKLRRAVITPEEFARTLRRSIETGGTCDSPVVKIDYEASAKWYLSQINNYSEAVERALVKRFGLAIVWLFPKAAAKLTAESPRLLKALAIKLKKTWRA
jgi:hypothetical protein